MAVAMECGFTDCLMAKKNIASSKKSNQSPPSAPAKSAASKAGTDANWFGRVLGSLKSNRSPKQANTPLAVNPTSTTSFEPTKLATAKKLQFAPSNAQMKKDLHAILVENSFRPIAT